MVDGAVADGFILNYLMEVVGWLSVVMTPMEKQDGFCQQVLLVADAFILFAGDWKISSRLLFSGFLMADGGRVFIAPPGGRKVRVLRMGVWSKQ